MSRQPVRALGAVLALLVLLVPAGRVMADDDPGPVQWPRVDPPGAVGNQSDPLPVKWPKIAKPETGGEANDPQPVKWPAPARG